MEHPGAASLLATCVIHARNARRLGELADDQAVVAHRRADDRERGGGGELVEASLDVVDRSRRKSMGLARDELYFTVEASAGLLRNTEPYGLFY